MINMISHFPGNCIPRRGQTEILEKIQKALEEKTKYIIIQAPTGAGKSHIAATLANFSDHPSGEYIDYIDKSEGLYRSTEEIEYDPWGAAILTVTKSLQDQYNDTFNTSRILKGKSNYVCAVDNDFDCDVAPCTLNREVLKSCMKENKCPLVNARRETLKSRFAVFNYSMFLSLPAEKRKRQFLICDEASELEDELVKNFSCTIEYDKINDVGIEKLLSEDLDNAYAWLSDLSALLSEIVSENEKSIKESMRNKKTLMKRLIKHRFYKNLCEKLCTIISYWNTVEYVIEISKEGVSFTPLLVNNLAQKLFESGETVILMSATLINHEEYARSLGIQKEDYTYIEIDSTFNPSYSPIFFDNKIKLNYKNMQDYLPKLCEKALTICNHFTGNKGIIHTHTFKIAEAIVSKIKNNKRFLVRKAGISNEFILNEHYNRDDDTVLISPSMVFGVDLNGDFGGFGIVMKTPYPSLNSKRIKKLASMNQAWYEMKTLTCLIQMCGRTTRNENDKSYTFILDGAALDLLKKNIDKIPTWFIKRIH